MNYRFLSQAIALLSCCLLSTTFGGGKDEVIPIPDASTDSETFVLSGEYTAETTFVGGGHVSSDTEVIRDFDENDTIIRFIFTPRIKLGVLRLGAECERFSFDYASSAPLPDSLQAVSLVLGLDTQLSDSILVRFEMQPGVYNTGFDNLSDDFNVPFIVGGTYIYSPNLQFIVGVSVDVERKYPVIPAAGIRWKLARQWVLNGVLPTPRVEFEPVKDITLYLGADMKQTNFRVDDHFGAMHGNTHLNHAVLTYSEVRTGMGLDWKITSVVTVSAEAGYQPYRSFDFYRATWSLTRPAARRRTEWFRCTARFSSRSARRSREDSHAVSNVVDLSRRYFGPNQFLAIGRGRCKDHAVGIDNRGRATSCHAVICAHAVGKRPRSFGFQSRGPWRAFADVRGAETATRTK